jgi:phosphoglycerol transferase MdoB-like AlkP superfamily enzyme
MKSRFRALGYFALFWLVYFFAARLIFILVQHRNSFDNSLSGLIGTFIHGIKLDISTTSYYLILPVLFSILWLWFKSEWYRVSIRWYTFLLIIFSSSIVVADATLYTYWGFRMDYTPFFYLKTPGEAMASGTTGEILLFFTAIVLISSAFIYLYKRFIDKLFIVKEKVKLRLVWTIVMLILFGSLIIPMRGGFGVAPINAGSVYFSPEMFLNHAAVNAVWNVGTTTFTHKPVKNPYVYLNSDEAAQIVDSLTTAKGIPPKILTTERPNVIFIILESFSGYLIGPMGGDSLVTPNLNRYIKEGILFSEFYASGNRTDKAIPAILNAYPAQPAQSIIKEPKKSQSLPGLVKIFNELGYNSSFWYGGEIDFANFNSFVIGSGFNTIVTMDDFDPKDYNSKWGVHDHVMFKALADSMKSVKEPFLKVVLTLSSHEPFDVPMEPVFSGEDQLTKYRNSVYYADKYLGEFLDWARTTSWWKNTLVIMLADHCCRISEETPVYSQEIFRIPMVWAGGALKESGGKITKPGSQVDIPVTLLNQLGLKGDFPFGKDLLSAGSNPFAFYTYNEGFAFITDTSAVIFDKKLNQAVLKEGNGSDEAEKFGKAYLQVLFDDYLKR